MLNKLRAKLTRLYAAIISGFLFSFVVVVSIGLFWFIYLEQVAEMTKYAGEIVKKKQVELLEYNQDNSKDTNIAEIANERDISGATFYYIYAKNDRLVIADKAIVGLNSQIRKRIREWIGKPNPHIGVFSLNNGQKAVVLMVDRPFFVKNSYEGVVYAGKDITAYSRVLVAFLIILAVVGLLFAILAVRIGRLLSGKAIAPVVESLARQKEFVADASHELRTPLSVLLTSVEALQSDRENSLSVFSVQLIIDMRDEILQLNKIVGEMLTLAQTDGGTIIPHKKEFMLLPVVNQVIRRLQVAAEEKKVQLSCEIKEADISLVADWERIQQLLFILLDNAIKYNKAGGIVRVAAEKIVKANGVWVEIAVQDNGIGIPEQYQNKIFGRFFRVDKARSREIGGAGLGLAIASWIIEIHGGKMWVESEEDKGSLFIVQLPGENL